MKREDLDTLASGIAAVEVAAAKALKAKSDELRQKADEETKALSENAKISRADLTFIQHTIARELALEGLRQVELAPDAAPPDRGGFRR